MQGFRGPTFQGHLVLNRCRGFRAAKRRGGLPEGPQKGQLKATRPTRRHPNPRVSGFGLDLAVDRKRLKLS